MGVDIGELLEKKEIELGYLDGRILGFDAYNILYQFLSIIRGRDGLPLMDSKGRVTSHLTGLLYRTSNLLMEGIKPVFVFDGKPSHLKTEEVEKRKAVRREAEKKWEKARARGEEAEARKYAMRASKITDEILEDSQKLLELMGLPWIQAPGEGEAQIAFMQQKGDLYGCVSQDFDALLHGTERLYRNLAVTGKRKLPGKSVYVDVSPEEIVLSKNLDRLGIDQKKLVWLGILIGTDYNKGVKGVGPKTGLKLVQGHESFEEILEEKGWEIRDWKAIEEIFLNPRVEKEYEITFSKPREERLKEFMVEEHDFSLERVESLLKKLREKREEKGAQSRLSEWS